MDRARRVRQTGPVTYLIAPAELAGQLAAAREAGGTGPTVLDVRWRLGGPPGREAYAEGHLPGAAFVDLDVDVCGPPGADGRHPLPDPLVLQAALRRAGVSADHPVVVYDHGDAMPAARLWWTLRWAGHPDVRVLDGGYAAWTAAGQEVTTDVVAPDPGNFTVAPGRLPVLDGEGAAAIARRGVLIDARQAPRYRGEVEPVDPVAGHIPGAVNVPLADLVEPDGRFRPAKDLRERFAAAGVAPGGRPVAAYCGSGVTAAHTMLALAEADIDDAALYVGSWSNWVADPTRPVATGEAP